MPEPGAISAGKCRIGSWNQINLLSPDAVGTVANCAGLQSLWKRKFLFPVLYRVAMGKRRTATPPISPARMDMRAGGLSLFVI